MNGYISTGQLPPESTTDGHLAAVYEQYRGVTEGTLSTVYPALGEVDPSLFGLCLVNVNGRTTIIGDTDVQFPIMSVVKPFVFAVVCHDIGPEAVRQKIGVNSTGHPFNSITAIEQSTDGRTNPMVNAGAIATTSMLPGDSAEDRWQHILTQLGLFAGRELNVMDDIYASASETNHRNRSIANALEGLGRMYGDVAESLDVYTRVCSLAVSARDLATMGATLAHGGKNPVTGINVVREEVCQYTLAVMTTAGMYETSGDWLYDVGLPGKSGIGGGMVTVAPGKGSLGTFGPLLDVSGNSIKGQLVAKDLSRRLGMGLFISGRE